jgi:hypothetical protein
MPTSSHFHFDLFASLAGEPETEGTSWMDDLHFLVYLVLDEDADYRRQQAKMPEVVEKYMGPDLQQVMGGLVRFPPVARKLCLPHRNFPVVLRRGRGHGIVGCPAHGGLSGPQSHAGKSGSDSKKRLRSGFSG